MAKKHEKPQEAPKAPAPAQPQQPPAAAPVSPARIWTFWCAVALAVIAARVLNQMFPGIPESVLERRVMLAFGAFLALFLLKLK